MISYTDKQLQHRLRTLMLMSMLMIGSITAEPAESTKLPEQPEEIDTSELTVDELEIDEKLSNEELAEEARQSHETFTFYGTKTLSFYRNQTRIAELDFYKMFNNYADKTKYKIKCRKEARTGSRVMRTKCYPIYLLNRISRETAFARKGGFPLPSIGEIDRQAADEKAEFVKYSEKLVNKHPELFEKLLKFGVAKKTYEDKKAQQ